MSAYNFKQFSKSQIQLLKQCYAEPLEVDNIPVNNDMGYLQKQGLIIMTYGNAVDRIGRIIITDKGQAVINEYNNYQQDKRLNYLHIVISFIAGIAASVIAQLIYSAIKG